MPICTCALSAVHAALVRRAHARRRQVARGSAPRAEGRLEQGGQRREVDAAGDGQHRARGADTLGRVGAHGGGRQALEVPRSPYALRPCSLSK
jgi:hypothetical protein